MTGTKAHFIREIDGLMVANMRIEAIPRPGDECRFPGPFYYRVTRVIHVYDESEPNRVNIGLEAVE